MGSLKNEDEVEQSNEAILYVNGVRRVLPDGLAHLTLLEYLRGNSTMQLSPYNLLSLSLVVSYVCICLVLCVS